MQRIDAENGEREGPSIEKRSATTLYSACYSADPDVRTLCLSSTTRVSVTAVALASTGKLLAVPFPILL